MSCNFTLEVLLGLVGNTDFVQGGNCTTKGCPYGQVGHHPTAAQVAAKREAAVSPLQYDRPRIEPASHVPNTEFAAELKQRLRLQEICKDERSYPVVVMRGESGAGNTVAAC